MNEPTPIEERDSRWRVHLSWMMDNQPDLLWQLHQQNRLAAHLDQKHQQGLARVDQLKQARGLSEDEAFEVAMEEILAPSDGPAMSDNPPTPLPIEKQRLVRRALSL